MLTERGMTFGYQDLVVDFRNIPDMQKNEVPVIVDLTHSLQRPNQSSGISGGNPEMIGFTATDYAKRHHSGYLGAKSGASVKL